MASFTRKDYEDVYAFALKVFHWHKARELEIEAHAIKVMKACEEVIGQQDNFPIEARDR